MHSSWSTKVQVLVLLAVFGAMGTAWNNKDYLSLPLTVLDGADQTSPSHPVTARSMGVRPPVPVIVTHVKQLPDNATIAAVGSARARQSVMLFSKSDGQVTSLSVEAGQRVDKGYEFLKLDDRKVKLAVKLAEKSLEDAHLKLTRAEYLQKRNVHSAALVADAIIGVDRAMIELQQERENLSDMRLVAPFAGIAGIPKVEIGDRVTTNTEIVTLDDRSELFVEFQVPEKFTSRIDVGDRVLATTPSHGGRTFNGKIGYIDTRVDPMSRSLMVRAAFPNQQDLLRPGMSFFVRLELPGETYAAVPELSLKWRHGESFVWIVKDGKAKRTSVNTVRRIRGMVLVDGALARGDLVVVEGVRVRPGADLTYVAPSTPTELPPPPKTTQSTLTTNKQEG